MANFVLAGFLTPHDGYGYGTRKLGQALHRLTDGEVATVDLRAQMQFDRPVVAVCVPDWLEGIAAPRLIAHCMFEATGLPLHWAPALNRYTDAVLVPCAQNVSVFRNNGVNPPIYVVPWGIDPEDYPYTERVHRDAPYTFLWNGTGDRRKGWDVAYRAFRAAFEDRRDVKLVLHFRQFPKGISGCEDPNVEVVAGIQTRAELRTMLADADCYVFPSRGEGWGLPPREAAATGLPVLVTNWGGLAEGIEHYALPLPVARTSPADFGFWTDPLGVWAEPDFDALVTWMRWCAANREVAAAFGRRASAWLQTYQTWDQSAQALLDAVAHVWLC